MKLHMIVSIAGVGTITASELPQRCTLPSDQGPCRAAMPRYAFNPDTKQCEQFVFGGCLGNENNFFTESDCENACEAYIPYQEQQENEQPDLPDIQARFLEVGDIEEVSKSSDDGCSDAPFEMGRCRARISRWSWNPETLACEKFVFGGCQGNGNNFGSKKKCLKTCEYLASQRNMQFDAVEPELEEEEEEPENVEPEVDPCGLPSKMGPCRARFNRFYFNSETGDCESFTWGGCEANANNFQSKNDCREKCVKSGPMVFDVVEEEPEEEEDEEEVKLKTSKPKNLKKGKSEPEPETDICSLKADPGFCRGYFEMWHFNGEECVKFGYGGCQGNANRFETKQACEDKCAPITARFFEEEPKNDVPVCEQKIESGPCRALQPKFAFNGKECVGFMFGGCMGNANNFNTMQACRAECMMQNDEIKVEEEEEEESEADSREAIREAKKRERQALRKAENKKRNRKGGKNGNKGNKRVKGVSREEEDEMRQMFNSNQLFF